MEYFIVLMLCIFCAYKKRKMASSLRVFCVVSICLVMILLIGLRYRVGVDTLNYMNSYASAPKIEMYIKHFSLSSIRDPLFHLIESICRTCTPDFWPFQLILTSISTTGIVIFINRNSTNPFIGLAIFILLQWLYFTTEILRESIAIAIFLLNYQNIKKRRFLRYYLISFLSIGFHYSAMITWVVPFCIKLRINFYYILICIGIILSTPLLDSLNQLLAIATITDRVNQYMNQAEMLNFNWRLAELIRSATLPLAIIIICKLRKLKIQFQGMILLQIIFCLGTFAVPVIFLRFTNYTALFITVVLSNLLGSQKLLSFLKLSLCCLIIVSQFHYYSQIYHRWFPYVSIFKLRQVVDREYSWQKESGC